MDKRVAQTAEAILSRAWGAPVRLRAGADDGLDGRTYVHRAIVEGAGGQTPTTVIVKEPRSWEGSRYAPSRPGGPAATFLAEWAGLELLTERGGESLVAPRFYGGDASEGVLVMEDLGTGQRLDHALLADDPDAAVAALNALTGALARMHAQTATATQRYSQLRNALGPTARGELRHNMPTTRGRWFASVSERVALKPARGFHAEMNALRQRWNHADEALCYVHFDPCPDNCHWVGGELRLLDFESGKLAPWGVDAAYARIHFPTCWCANRLPDAVWRGAEAGYRRELGTAWPQAADDGAFQQGMMDACAYWAFRSGMLAARSAWDEDREWGISMVRQRAIMRFDMLADTSDEFGLMPATGATSRALAARLREQWPDSQEMPVYPAFRPRSEQESD